MKFPLIEQALLGSLLIFSIQSFAKTDLCQVAVCPSLESSMGRPLTAENQDDLERLILLIQDLSAVQISERQRLHTKTILCLGIAYDAIYVGGHPFVCSDFFGRKFGGFGFGVGFGAGISGNAFALIGRLLPGKDIVGKYSGGHASAAFGYYGAGGGVLFRNGEYGVLPDPRFREKVFWIGYEVGLDLDISAMELAIWQW